MSSPRQQFRTVNRVLGEQPKIGPFPADQVFPWSAIALLTYFLVKVLFNASWLVTCLVIGWGWASWWTLSSNKTWMGKFVRVPRIVRGYQHFQSLVKKQK